MYNNSPLAWGLWAIALLVAAVALWPIRGASGVARWANPKTAFGFAYLVFHVIRPLYLLITGDFYGVRLGFYVIPSADEMIPMLLASAVGGISFLLGWRFGANHIQFRLRRTRPEAASTDRQRPESSLAARILVLVPVAILAFVIGGEGTVSADAINLYYFLRASLIAICYLLVIAAVRMDKKRYFALAAGVAAAYLWLFWRESGTSRLFLLMFLVPGLVVATGLLKRKALVVVPVVAAVMVLTFMFLSNNRYELKEGASMVEQIDVQRTSGAEGLYSYLLRGGDFDAFERGMVITQLIPDYDPPYLGGSFATLLVMPIPRSLWTEKPAVSPTDTIVKWYPNTPENFAISLIGEAYANWLWPGVVGVLFVLGFVSMKVTIVMMKRIDDAEMWVMSGLYLSYVILVIRGSFHTMTSYFLFCLFWFWISDRLVRLLLRRRVVTLTRPAAYR